MESRYERNIPALSEEQCQQLRTKRILVAGCGGLGGHLIELLSRIGIGFIRAIDGDVFESSNLNRQLLSETALLGIGKADAASIRVARINPDVTVDSIKVFIDENNAENLIEGMDVVLDALDNIESRRILAKACSKAGIPYIYGAIRGWVSQAGISMPGDHMIDLLYPEGSVLKDKSVLSFTPALCASMQAALCVKLLTEQPVVTGELYYFDLLNQEFEIIPLALTE